MSRTNPPFLHPRRDGYLSRARRRAALLLSLLQGGWFMGVLLAVQSGVRLDLPFSALGLAGIFLVAARAQLVADLSLGALDRQARLACAPDTREMFRRATIGLLIPVLLLVSGLLLARFVALLWAVLLLLLACEILYRVGGFTRWQTPRIHEPVLRHLLSGSPEGALAELDAAGSLNDPDREMSVLAISGVAIRQRKAPVLAALEAHAGRWVSEVSPDPRGIPARTLAILRADHARLLDAENSARQEAEALALLPPGHPRRLAFGLFVATAALDEGDPQSALKAIERLHTRDALASPGRFLVNRLLLDISERIQDADLALRCRQVLATFDATRISATLSSELADRSEGPYSRWLWSFLRQSPHA